MTRSHELICCFCCPCHPTACCSHACRKYLTGEAPTRSEFTGWSDYTKSKGFLTVIEKGLYHKETGGLEDAAKKPDSECTLQQIAVKAWFFLCGGDKDTLEVDNDMVDLTDSIGDKIKQSRQAAEERRLAGTAEGEDQQRRGQEVRDLASGAVSEHKEEVEFQILDITLRHDLVNLVLNAKEYNDDEFRKIRYVCYHYNTCLFEVVPSCS